MKRYVVLDTNVLVSAMLKRNSVPGTILEFALIGKIEPVLNYKIVEEYRDVLMREKFCLTERIVEDLISALEERGEYINHPDKTDEVFSDAKDVVFYEVTMEKRKKKEAYLVTGNLKHFPEKSYVVSPHEMLEIVLSDEE